MQNTLVNEPITFDPAVREIAHEVARLAARVRSALRSRSERGWTTAEPAA